MVGCSQETHMKIWPILVLLVLVTGVNAETPYAGMQSRSVKALSEQQIADLSAGRGWSGTCC